MDVELSLKIIVKVSENSFGLKALGTSCGFLATSGVFSEASGVLLDTGAVLDSRFGDTVGCSMD